MFERYNRKNLNSNAISVVLALRIIGSSLEVQLEDVRDDVFTRI